MPDHVHAPCVLLVLGDCGQPRAARTVRGPVQALRGDAEPADVPQFQGSGDLLGRASFGLQSCPLALEVVSVRARDAADRVSRGRFQKHGVGAPQGFLLEPRRDGTPIDRLAGEQIGGAHERPDGDATLPPAARPGRRPSRRTGHRGSRRRRRSRVPLRGRRNRGAPESPRSWFPRARSSYAARRARRIRAPRRRSVAPRRAGTRGAAPVRGRAGRSGSPRFPVPSPGPADPRRSRRRGGDRCGWPRAAPCGSRLAQIPGCRRPTVSGRGGRGSRGARSRSPPGGARPGPGTGGPRRERRRPRTPACRSRGSWAPGGSGSACRAGVPAGSLPRAISSAAPSRDSDRPARRPPR